MTEPTRRTVETSPGIYAQGEFIGYIGEIAQVKDGDTVYTGKLVRCLRKCSKDAAPYQ